MSWISNITPPGIKKMFKREDDTPDVLWVKCPNCSDMIFHRDLEAAQNVCPSCGHHMRIGPKERFQNLFDGAYESIELPEAPADPLKFRDEKRYADRLRDARRKTSQQDAMEAAIGAVGGVETVILVQNFAFMGGSLGMAAGEAVVAAAERAVQAKAPLVVFAAAGGARMQEGILSLMQMPRTTLAVEAVKAAGQPYIVVLTDPTTGGVTASYAMLGDVHLAEPGALIGFAGPRVIEQTIREKLPAGFQRSEYLFEKGMVDAVVPRKELKSSLSTLLKVLTKHEASAVDAASLGVEALRVDGAANDETGQPADEAP
ncbi:MAG: acetyl-CoA carboxylase, carboxyltransferase subunit beta, partial [Pseudomonadota bacterium]